MALSCSLDLRCMLLPHRELWKLSLPQICMPCDEKVGRGTGMPDVVAVNNEPCAIANAALPPPPPPQSSHEEAASSLTTVNGQIIGLDGQPLTLWGINWFGFETGTTMVDGLWAGMHAATIQSLTVSLSEMLL